MAGDILSQILILLAGSVLVLSLVRRFALPPVVGYLVVGLILGPHALGDVMPHRDRSDDLFSLAQWSGQRATHPSADLSPYAIQGMRMTRDPLKFFEYTNFYTGVNPPPAEDTGLMELFKTVGVGPGSRLPDEYAVLLLNLFEAQGISRQAVSGCVLSSVVPVLTQVFEELTERYLGCKALVLNPAANILAASARSTSAGSWSTSRRAAWTSRATS